MKMLVASRLQVPRFRRERLSHGVGITEASSESAVKKTNTRLKSSIMPKSVSLKLPAATTFRWDSLQVTVFTSGVILSTVETLAEAI